MPLPSKAAKGNPTGAKRTTRSSSRTLRGPNPAPPSSSGATLRATGKQRADVFIFFEAIPLDIFGEIIGNLEPADVLRLARAGKSLRALLMNRNMTVYWKRARENVEGLPDCPNNLSEPAYANLMFSSHCHKCLAEGQDVLTHLEARVQLCYKCSLQEFKKWKDLPQNIDEALTDFIPATSEPLTAAERKQSRTGRSAQWRIEARTRFHVPTALALQKRYAALKPRAKAKWLEEQRAAWDSIEEHATLCRVYARTDFLNDSEQANVLYSDRQGGVIVLSQELGKLGYEDEFEHCGQCTPEEAPAGKTMYPIIAAARNATVKEWQTMKGPMVAYMEEVRVALRRHRQDADLRNKIALLFIPTYTTRVLVHPTRTSALPTIQDLALMEEVVPLLQNDALEASAEAARKVIEMIPGLMENYANKIEESLLDLLRQSPVYEGLDIDREALFYATTTFRCSVCDLSDDYPNVLAHNCFYKHSHEVKKRRSGAKENRGVIEEGPDADSKVNKETIRCAFRRDMVWAPGTRIRFNEAAYHHIHGVLGSLGMVPTTTTQTLRDLNPYVELRCKCFKGSSRDSKHRRQATRWSETIQSVANHRSEDYENALVPISEADLLEVPGYEARIAEPLNDWCICCFCGWQTYGADHFADEHGPHGVTQAQGMALYQHTPRKRFRGVYDILTLP